MISQGDLFMSLQTRQWLWLLTWALVSSAAVSADDSAEELPRPRSATTADVQTEPATNARRDIPSQGWSLKGERGQHLFVSEVAVADYTWDGQRHIVLLDQDNPALQERSDPYFLYYHERETDNRWAIGRYPSSGQDYVLYFQPADGPKVWTRFHRAHLSRNDDRSVVVVDAIVVIDSPVTVSIQAEPTCGY
jgi:hypothetical protein